MKIIVDFDDLFKDFENDESTATQIMDEVKRRAVDELVRQIAWQVVEELGADLREVDKEKYSVIKTLSSALIKKYKEKIEEDIKKVME